MCVFSNSIYYCLYVAVTAVDGAMYFAIGQFVFVRQWIEIRVVVSGVGAAEAAALVHTVVEARRADTLAATVVEPTRYTHFD